jgi:CRISPR/Cas system-associated exonuclease Cas4 (RecB family)
MRYNPLVAEYKKGYSIKTWGRFDPASDAPFVISRSKIDLFIECPRCAYLDLRLGVKRPSSFPMNLNNAVDTLLKKEFDTHRADMTVHPLVRDYGLNLVPLQDSRLDEWRDALRRGISFHHKKTNLMVRGGIDDIWQNPDTGEVFIVDYKATSKETEVSIDAEWQKGYKRQIEIYQWLFRSNGLTVSPTGYFVYVNGKTDAKAFDGKIEFDAKLIPYTGSTDWIEPTLETLKVCLTDSRIPMKSATCEFCGYADAVRDTLVSVYKSQQQNQTQPIISESTVQAVKTKTTKNTSTKNKTVRTLKAKKDQSEMHKAKTEKLFDL